MTANTGNGFTISASSNFSGFDPWKAVDGSTTTEWATNLSNSNFWYQVRTPAKVTIWKLYVRGRNSPNTERYNNWRFEASNDGSTWTSII